MTEGNVDIYIDSSFFTVRSGIGDVYSSFIAGELENIGQRDIPVDYVITPMISGVADSYIEFFATYSGAVNDDGFTKVTNEYKTRPTESGIMVSLVDYAIPATTSGLRRTKDAKLKYFTGSTKISGVQDSKVKFTAGEMYAYSTNILGSYFIKSDDVVEFDYESDYTAGGHYDPLIPGPPEDQVISSGIENFTQFFTTARASNSGTQQQECDLFLAGYPLEFHPNKYTYRFHMVAGIEDDKQGAEWEAIVIPGAVLDIPFDVYSSAEVTKYYNSDIVCGHVSLSGIDFPVSLVSYSAESEVISGTIGYYFKEAICGLVGTNSYTFDINLLSLKISNFSLDINEYTAASGTICVDITDDMHNVSTVGSYFIIGENVITSGTSFTPITDGYRMCFDSPTDFDSLIGTTTVTVHTSNDNNDILEQDFYLTSGYIVEYDNRTQNYGFGSQVVVRGSAENLASCPNTGVDAYFFTTEPKIGMNLGATIVGRPWKEGDLSAEIVPTTDTIYFYGKTFRIEIRAKDFAGNVMEPFTFEFKIEDKPE